MHARWLALASALATAGCYDTTLPLPPQPPGPGSLSGRVVVARPGLVAKEAVPGADVRLWSSSLATRSGADGRFRLDGVVTSEGTLHLSADVPGIGPRERVLDLATLGAGFGRQVELGDVALVENAVVLGRGLREDFGGSPTGHLNSLVFVPEGPYTAFTADDGTYVFEHLPEGHYNLAIYRDGYQPVGLELTARAGERLVLRDLVMPLLPAPATDGALRGQLRFSPEQPTAGDATVTALELGGPETPLAVEANGAFSASSLPPGLYDVVARRSGYAPAVVRNVLVPAGATVTLRDIVLLAGAETQVDAGQLPPPGDAGAADGGSDAGQDAGTDAGTDAGVDAGLCASTGDCPVTDWCDDGVCRRQCTSSGDCTNGRVCDTVTGTCIWPCDGGCAPDETCDTALNACRLVCDGSLPCPPGQRCNALSFCEPECAVTADCPAHRRCQGGACVRDGTCTWDFDCDKADFCTGGGCEGRRTAYLDAGVDGGPAGYACGMPCDCRLDEVCRSGLCWADRAPTRFLAADGGGDGARPTTPARDLAAVLADGGPDQSLALWGGDRFDLAATLVLDGGTRLAGGYVYCGPNRWVRDLAQSSTVWAPVAPVVQHAGSVASPTRGVELANLELLAQSFGTSPCTPRLNVEFSSIEGLKVENVRGGVVAPASGCGGNAGLLQCSGCRDLDVRNLEQLPLGALGDSAAFLPFYFVGASGRIDGLKVPATSQYAVYPLTLASQVGPLLVENLTIATPNVTAESFGVSASACGAHSLTVRNSRLGWPMGSTVVSGQGFALRVVGCSNVHLEDNVFTGASLSGWVPTNTSVVYAMNSGGTLARNRFELPTVTGVSYNGSARLLHFTGTAAFDITDNQTVPTTSGGVPVLVEVVDLTNGPLVFRRNTLSGGRVSNVREATGVRATNVSGMAGLTFEDNVITAPVGAGCLSSTGMAFSSSAALVERNRVEAPEGGRAFGVEVLGASSVELYENSVYAGRSVAPLPGVCGGALTALNASIALRLDGTASTQVYALGNTFDGAGEPGQAVAGTGVSCNGPVQGTFTSNLVGGGRPVMHPMVTVDVAANSTCERPADWRNNYFWYVPGGGPSAGDLAPSLVAADAGVPDARGNVLGLSASCLDLASPVRHTLLSSGPCVDRGVVGTRVNGTAPAADVDGDTRVQGPAADIGCIEQR
ncbi:MAG: hypothetical protein AMXMBFR34_36460 [Myxococcaceae bacterium]